MLSVGDGILDQILQEELEHGTGLFVDGTGDTLHTTTAGQAANGRLQGKCMWERVQQESGKWK